MPTALIIQFALQYGPDLARELIALFKKPTATLDDVDALLVKVQSYEQLAAAKGANPNP